MNVTVTHDQAGTMIFVPDEITITQGTSISVTMVPPSGASWTITAVESRPEETWSNNTAVLTENLYYISIAASDPPQGGTSTLRISIGVKDD